MTSSNGNIFRVTDHLCGEFTADRWIPRTNDQLLGALMFSLICAWINGSVNNREAGDSGRYRAHYDVTVMALIIFMKNVKRLSGIQKYHWYHRLEKVPENILHVNQYEMCDYITR